MFFWIICFNCMILFIKISAYARVNVSDLQNSSVAVTVIAKLCKANEDGCQEITDEGCDDFCRCYRNPGYYFDEQTQECIRDEYDPSKMYERYNNYDTLKQEADRIFAGMLVAACLFIACSIACVFAAFSYCFRMKYTDHTLKSNVKALGKRKTRNRRIAPKQKTPEYSQQCSVIMQDAGIMII